MEFDNPAMAKLMKPTTTTISNRKVEAKESITTAAGTFEAFKISYNTKVESTIMGMTRSFESSSNEWIAEGVGMVKVQSFDKKGKKQGTTELTSFKK